MHGIVYFLEDASVSVISKKVKRILTVDFEWKLKEKLEMKWDGLIYEGIIVKIGEDRSTLKEVADLMVEEVLQHLKGVPEDVPEELFRTNVQNLGGKRKRKPTEKLKESTNPGVQEEEPSKAVPKKKKGTNSASSSSSTHNGKVLETSSKRRQEKKKVEEAASLNEESGMMGLLQSPMLSQFKDVEDNQSGSPCISAPRLQSSNMPATTETPKHTNTSTTTHSQQNTVAPQFHETGLSEQTTSTPSRQQHLCNTSALQQHSNMPTITEAVTEQTNTTPSRHINTVQREVSSALQHHSALPTTTDTLKPTTWTNTTPSGQQNTEQRDTFQHHSNMPTTTMTETWGLVQQVQNLQDIPRCQICTMPADSAEIEEAPLIPILRRSPRKLGRIMQSADSDSPTFTTLKTPTKRPALNPSPRKSSSVSPRRMQVVQSDPHPMSTMHSTPTHKEDDERNLDAGLSHYISPVLNEKLRDPSQTPKDQGKKNILIAQKDKSVTRMRPLVKHRPNILVDEVQLNRYSKIAKSHANPGYTMTMKIMPLLFTDTEMALSRGQGLAPPAKGDLRPVLDPERMATLREYIPAWCSISNTDQPSDKEFNKAITEAISYARKKEHKRAMKTSRSSENKQSSE